MCVPPTAWAAGNGENVPRNTTASPRGFVLDMTPLLGVGRISGLAPGAAAFVGTTQVSKETPHYPCVWTRELGLRQLAIASDTPRGIAMFLGDAGDTVAGYVYADAEGAVQSGVLWRKDQDAVFTLPHLNLFMTDWAGVTADGALAAGKSRWITGFQLDAENRYTRLPGSRGYDPHAGKPLPVAPRADGSVPDDPFVEKGELMAVSRDGTTFAFGDRPFAYLADAQRRNVRELKVGGVSPLDKDRLLRAGETPLNQKRHAALTQVSVDCLNKNGEFAAGSVTVTYPLSVKGESVDAVLRRFTEGSSVGAKTERFIVRWGPENQLDVLGKGEHWVEAMSDDGKSVLLRDGYDYSLWREGKGRASFAKLLQEYGLFIPGQESRQGWRFLVMSPDGVCFAGKAQGDEFAMPALLICFGEEAVTPTW